MASNEAFILQGTIDVDINQAVKGLKKVDGEVNNSGNSLDKFSSKLGGIAKGIVAAFSVKAIVDFGKKCLGAASDVQEMQNKFDVVFAKTSDSMEKWASDYADAIGRSSFDIKTAVANQSDLMMGMGMTEDQASDLSKKFTQLAYDLGSFNNVQDTTALEAMTKAMYGETEMAKQLGVNLSATVMENSDYVKSLGKSWSALTQVERAEAYYQEALKQSPNAFGDATRSVNSYESQMRRAKAKVEEFTQTLGGYFLPMATNVVNWFGNMVNGAIGFVTKFADCIGLFKSTLVATGDPAQALVVMFDELFGVRLPDSFLYMVECCVSAFQTLWQVALEIWNTVAVPIIDSIKLAFADLGTHSDGIFRGIGDFFKALVDNIKIIWETVGKPVFDFIMQIIQAVKGVFDENFVAIQGLVQNVFGDIINIWNNNLRPCFEAIGSFIQNVLGPVFTWLLNNIVSPVFGGILASISSIWNSGVKPIFIGIIDFITGVFSGNWGKAWNGIVTLFKGIFEGIGAIVKLPLNAIIGIINGAIGLINGLSIDIPDWVPVLGGKKFSLNIPKMNYLYNGGIVTQPTLLNSNTVAGDAYKGKGNQAEAVIPLDDLKVWIKDLASRPVKVAIDGHEFVTATASEFDINGGERLMLAGRGLVV